ncbi:UNVERIFIED_CONTAM: hypothetical protein GTU68_052060 [Idotea baltica]|nr:hypothetical protein [Idotea baltica]
MKLLISIIGPTAVGKSNLSVDVAKAWGAPVISADSVQIFRGLNIGSGKVTPEEMQGVPHYMLDIIDPTESYSAGRFGREVDALLPKLFEKHEVVILTGGAGFYFHAVWNGMDDIPETDPKIRAELNDRLALEGLGALVAELEVCDPVAHGKVDLQNPVRVIRALEVFHSTGTPISVYQNQNIKENKDYAELRIGLEMDRELLYERINLRVEKMVEAGLEDEVLQLADQHGADAKGLQSVGYREFVDCLKGLHDKTEAVRLIQRNSRRYAKRQYTWFRKAEGIEWFPVDDQEAIRHRIKAVITEMKDKENAEDEAE